MANSRSAVVFKHASSSLLALFKGKGLYNETIKTMAFSILILVINMVTGMITARMLGPEGRGLLTTMILWPQFLGFATAFGLSSALLYHVKKSPEEEGDLYYSSLIICGCTGLFAIAIGVVFIPFWIDGHSLSTILVGQFFMLVAPFMHLFFLSNAFFRAREEFHLFNRMRYAVPLLTLMSLLVLSAADFLTPYTAGLAYLVPFVPVVAWAVYVGIKIHRPRLRGLGSSIKRIFRYGMGSYGIDLLGNIILYVDQIILVALLAPGPLGLYVVAVSLSRIVNVFSSSIVMVLFPKATGLPDDKAALLILRVFKLSTAFAVLGASIIILVAPTLMNFLYGGQFLGAIPVFRLLLFDVVIGGAAFVLAQAFMATGKPIIVTVSQAIGIVLVIPLMYFLVPNYGIIGAGWALLIPSIVRLIFILVVFKWKFKYKLGPLFLITGKDISWLKDTIQAKKAKKEGSVEL